MKTLFLSFDGLDGSGKSWAVEELARRLRTAGVRVWAGKLRPKVGTSRLYSKQEISRFCLRLRRVMDRLAAKHDVVLLDRSMVSYFTYWTFWYGVASPETVWRIAEERGCFASLNVVLFPSIRVCRKRIRARGDDPFALNAQGEDYLRAFKRYTQKAVKFLKPRLGDRLVVFEDNVAAVAWVLGWVSSRSQKCQERKEVPDEGNIHLF